MVENTCGHVLARVRGQEATGAILDGALGSVASDGAEHREDRRDRA